MLKALGSLQIIKYRLYTVHNNIWSWRVGLWPNDSYTACVWNTSRPGPGHKLLAFPHLLTGSLKENAFPPIFSWNNILMLFHMTLGIQRPCLLSASTFYTFKKIEINLWEDAVLCLPVNVCLFLHDLVFSLEIIKKEAHFSEKSPSAISWDPIPHQSLGHL